MLFSQLPLFAVLAAVLSLLSRCHAGNHDHSDINNPDLKQLTSVTFDSTIAKGAWLVEFFAPWCGHCKAFAPTWADVSDMEEHLETTSDFHLRRVNCVEFGDLCTEQKVKGFPSLYLYQDGKFFKKYDGNRTFQHLTTWIEAAAADYREVIAQKAAAVTASSHVA